MEEENCCDKWFERNYFDKAKQDDLFYEKKMLFGVDVPPEINQLDSYEEDDSFNIDKNRL